MNRVSNGSDYPFGLKGNQVKILNSPAAVSSRKSSDISEPLIYCRSGRRRNGASQKTCPFVKGRNARGLALRCENILILNKRIQSELKTHLTMCECFVRLLSEGLAGLACGIAPESSRPCPAVRLLSSAARTVGVCRRKSVANPEKPSSHV